MSSGARNASQAAELSLGSFDGKVELIDADTLLAEGTIQSIVSAAQEAGVESVLPPAPYVIVAYDSLVTWNGELAQRDSASDSSLFVAPLLMRRNAFLQLNNLEFLCSTNTSAAQFEYELAKNGVPLELSRNMRSNREFVDTLASLTTLGTFGPIEVRATESYLISVDFSITARNALGQSTPMIFWLDIKLSDTDWRLDVARTSIRDTERENRVCLQTPINLSIGSFGSDLTSIAVRVRAATELDELPRAAQEPGFLDSVKTIVAVASQIAPS